MSSQKGLMEGKKVLILGVANERSIAWGIASRFHDEGATLGFTYQGEVLEKRVRPLAERVESDLVIPCDVTDEASLETLFQTVKEKWGGLDCLVHSIAFANREDLDGRFVDTSREGFLKALEISAFSLVNVAKHAEPFLKESKGNIVTMTFYGSQKVVPNYNVMGVAKAALEAAVRYLAVDLGEDGIRVNAISAGPVKTLAAAGVRNFRVMLSEAAKKAPLKRNISQLEVGNAALFLCSSLGEGVTGEILFVDAGMNIAAV